MNPTNDQKASAKSDTDHIANPPVLNPAKADPAGPNDTIQGKPKNAPGEPSTTGPQATQPSQQKTDPLQVFVKNPNQDQLLNQDFAQNRKDDGTTQGVDGTADAGKLQGKR